MIEVQNLSKRYGRTQAVDGLSFTVRPGQVTGFLGPNGGGKSTTMRMMLDLDRPTAGRVLIDGGRYRELCDPLRRIGALVEAKSVHGGRTARNHLLWLAQSNRIPKSRVREVIEQVGLESVAGRRARGFSLGMGQRLGIAAALLADPPILLLDEPVNGLDPEGILWIRNLMKGLAAEGRTVFVSSHLMSEMVLTGTLLVFGVSLIVAVVTFATAQTAIGSAHNASISDEGVPRAIFGAVLYMTLLTTFSMGTAAMLRSPAPALGILVPLFFMVSEILNNVPKVRAVAQFLPDAAGQHILRVVPRDDTVLGPWTGMLVLAGWTAAAVLGGYLALCRRDA